jgi:hypothetical protein
MDSTSLLIICAGTLIVMIIPVSVVAYFIIKRGWLSIRLLAIVIFSLFTIVGLGFWLLTGTKQIFTILFLMAIIGSLIILVLPRTNPSLLKLLNIKW